MGGCVDSRRMGPREAEQLPEVTGRVGPGAQRSCPHRQPAGAVQQLPGPLSPAGMAGESGRPLCVLGVLSLRWAQVFVGNRPGGRLSTQSTHPVCALPARWTDPAGLYHPTPLEGVWITGGFEGCRALGKALETGTLLNVSRGEERAERGRHRILCREPAPPQPGVSWSVRAPRAP